MKRPLRILATVMLVAAILVGAACATIVYRNRATYGTVVTEANRSVTVDQGGRLTLAVPDRGASVGDSWSQTTEPSQVLTFIEERHVVDDLAERVFGSPPGGGAGDTYFIFAADRPGTASVTLTNCFQGCGTARSKAASRSVTWQVTVRNS